MAIGPESAAVNPRIRYRVNDLLASTTEHACNDGRGRNSNEQNVVQADAIESVIECQYTLNLVRLDHGGQDVAESYCRLALLTVEIVRDRKNTAKVVGGMSPLGCEPGVIEIEPPNYRSDIERCRYRIELERFTGDPRAAGELSAGYNRAEQLLASGIVECEDAATQRIEQTVEGGAAGFSASRIPFEYIVGDTRQQFVRVRADGVPRTDVCCHRADSLLIVDNMAEILPI